MNRIGFIESLAQLLSKSSPSKIHTEETLKTYLLGRINDFDIPNPHSWNEEADKLRQSLLQDVIFKGVPEEWISAEPEIIQLKLFSCRTFQCKYLLAEGYWIIANAGDWSKRTD